VSDLCLKLPADLYFARKLFDRRLALWSGWAWAFFPYAIYFPAERIWSTWLSTALFSVLFCGLCTSIGRLVSLAGLDLGCCGA